MTLDQVHRTIGVLCSAHNVSKGIKTTTSDFAPGVYADREVQQFMPYRLDLRPQKRLLEWLTEVAGTTVTCTTLAEPKTAHAETDLFRTTAAIGVEERLTEHIAA